MSLEEKISTLTTIPTYSINKFKTYLNVVHSHDIVYAIVSDEDSIKYGDKTIKIDLFEGTLLMKVENDFIKYKFIPNEEFNNIVKEAIVDKKSKLIDVSEQNLKKLLKMYKEII